MESEISHRSRAEPIIHHLRMTHSKEPTHILTSRLERWSQEPKGNSMSRLEKWGKTQSLWTRIRRWAHRWTITITNRKCRFPRIHPLSWCQTTTNKTLSIIARVKNTMWLKTRSMRSLRTFSLTKMASKLLSKVSKEIFPWSKANRGMRARCQHSRKKWLKRRRPKHLFVHLKQQSRLGELAQPWAPKRPKVVKIITTSWRVA